MKNFPKTFGLPYKGSKNSIALWVIENLPEADTFCDLFCGGCAVTHAAMVSGKYNHFIINDIKSELPELFVECCNGKHTTKTHTEWITREKFNAEKSKNAYIAMCWSFSNNGCDYLYSRDKEESKKALHDAAFFNDLSGLEKLGINLKKSECEDVYDRYAYYRKQLREICKESRAELQRLENLQRLQRLENLERLQHLENLERLQRLERFGEDYQKVKIPCDSVIYCDVPYKGTRCGCYSGFDHDRFYEWAEKQDNIFISEYIMPDNFPIVAQREKTAMKKAGGCRKVIEKLFTNQKTFEKIKPQQLALIEF